MNTIEKASVVLFFASAGISVNNLIDVVSIDHQLKKNSDYNYSLVLDDASTHIDSAVRDMSYRTHWIGPVISYDNPDGIATRRDIDIAISDLQKEYKIVEELNALESEIPNAYNISTIDNQQVIDRLNDINSEINIASKEKKSAVKKLIDTKRDAGVKFLIFLYTALFASPLVGVIGYMRRKKDKDAES